MEIEELIEEIKLLGGEIHPDILRNLNEQQLKERIQNLKIAKNISIDKNDKFIGQKFGKLVIFQLTKNGWSQYKKYLCICLCGNYKNCNLSSLRYSKSIQCKECKFAYSKMKPTYEEVRQFFKEKGCILLEQNYIGNSQRLKFQCSCGNISKISFTVFKNGGRCFNCGYRQKYTLERLNNLFKENGCILLEQIYLNPKTPMKYICQCGNLAIKTLDKFLGCPFCRECIKKRQTGENSPTWNPNREYIENRKIFCRNQSGYVKQLKNIPRLDPNKINERLGYSQSQLINHLENHINMEYIGHRPYTIDHIFPISAFFKHGILDTKIINCLDNLQPLLSHDNSKKIDKYNHEEFKKWLLTKGINLKEHECQL